MSRCCAPSRPAGPPRRPCRGTTAATLALSWTSRLSRWRRWIQRCLLFHLAIASGTCCWGTRHYRMTTGSIKHTVSFCATVYEKLPRDISRGDFVFLCMCTCIHLLYIQIFLDYLKHSFQQFIIFNTFQELLSAECCSLHCCTLPRAA